VLPVAAHVRVVVAATPVREPVRALVPVHVPVHVPQRLLPDVVVVDQ
jgi:hypothetical protein